MDTVRGIRDLHAGERVSPATHGPGRAPATPPSVETFAADIDFRAPSLSPDGKLIAYTGRVGGRRVLIVLDRKVHQHANPRG